MNRPLKGIISLLIGLLSVSPTWAKIDYCEVYKESGTVLFIIDRTDSFDQHDKAILADGAAKLLTQIKAGDRLVIHTITGDHTQSKRIFDECKPGCPDKGFFNSLVSNCRPTRAARELRQFQGRFLRSAKPLVDQKEHYRHSAIIETLNHVGHEYQRQALYRVVLFSDLIENSLILNFAHLHKKRIPDLFDQLETQQLIPSLPNVQVDIFGFGRAHGKVRAGLKPNLKIAITEFWTRFFTRSGVKKIDIRQYLEPTITKRPGR